MKKFLLTFTTISLVASSACAVDVTPPGSATATPASLNAAPAAGKARASKVNYETLSHADKIKFVNERHQENLQKAAAKEAKWKTLTDDQKIAQFEKRRNDAAARHAAKTKQNADAATPVQSLAPAAGTPAPVSTPSVIK